MEVKTATVTWREENNLLLTKMFNRLRQEYGLLPYDVSLNIA